jgi:hypothetical protein
MCNVPKIILDTDINTDCGDAVVPWPCYTLLLTSVKQKF